MSTDDYPKNITLKGGQQVVVRLLNRGDYEALCSYFRRLPAEDRAYSRHDLTDRALIRKWTDEINLHSVIPMTAWDGDRIVAAGSLHIAHHGWMQHIGHLRLTVASTHRRLGLGTKLARELVALAEERGLEKLQVHLIEDHPGPIRMFEAVGFEVVTVIRDLVKDRHGKSRGLAVMINDVANLERVMEDWIQDSMIPAFRAPGGSAV